MEQLAIWAAVLLGGIVSGFAGFAFSAVAGAITPPPRSSTSGTPSA
jgi:hypothetical protein